LDDSMKDLVELVDQLKRQNLLDPDFKVTLGGLITVLTKLLSIFKWQRAIIEELKEFALADGVKGASRRWLGIALGRHAKGVMVRRVLPGSPAEAAKLLSGDVIVRAGTTETNDALALMRVVNALRPGEPLSLGVLRDAQETTAEFVPKMLLAPELDITSGLIRDKKCSDECACESPEEGALCGSAWYLKGNGPKGGVLYEVRCSAIDDSGNLISNKRCGPYECF
ncbi:MAG TPA: PDZ domain-containing protein, partial [Candidatus Elarobacter sp.]